MSNFSVSHESRLIHGHVLDCSHAPLLAALRRYDPQLNIAWNSKKRAGRGCWQLVREHELKTVMAGRFLDTPHKGRVYVPGDVHPNIDWTIVVPRQRNDFVKDFDHLTYDMVSWIAKQDLWQYGHKGKNFVSEADYNEAKYMERIEDEADKQRQYMIRQHRTVFNDYRAFINAGGNPAEIADHWNKL